jgi:integrase
MTDHRRDATTYLNEVLFKAGLPFSVHKLRHTYASKLLKSGVSIADIKDLLGHSSIYSTMRSHLEHGSSTKKAADILNQQTAEMNRKSLKVV